MNSKHKDAMGHVAPWRKPGGLAFAQIYRAEEAPGFRRGATLSGGGNDDDSIADADCRRIFPQAEYQQYLRAIINRWVQLFCYFAALLTISALFLIFGYIFYRGRGEHRGVCRHGISIGIFSQRSPGYPDDTIPIGLRNCIAGSLTLIFLSSLIGVPVGMLCGIYLAEYARENWWSHAIRLVVDVLAGVPSIIVGVLGYELVVVPMKANSAWAGAVALGFIMCPIVARTTEGMLRLVPKSLREASIGLGGSKAQTLFRIVIPAASSGIITGVMLAVARVAGETAPLIFTAGSSDLPVFSFQRLFSIFTRRPVAFVSVVDGQNFRVSRKVRSPVLIQLAWGGMLILIAVVLVLNICVRMASRKNRTALKQQSSSSVLLCELCDSVVCNRTYAVMHRDSRDFRTKAHINM